MSDTQILEVIITLLPIIIALCAAGYQYMLAGLPERKRTLVAIIVNDVVKGVEQAYGVLEGTTKKNEAVRLTTVILKDLRISVNPDMVSSLIEAAIYSIHQYQQKPKAA